ncbi:UNVERIFIED_CONTAM: Cytochrome [Sesamum indicum]
MLLHFGNVPTRIVSSADAAGEIMKTHDLIFADRPESRVSRQLLYNFKDVSISLYGEYWRQLKSICGRRNSLLVNKIRKSSFPVNLNEMFAELTNDVICRSAFGRNIGHFIPGMSWINCVNGFDARVDKVSEELDEFLEGVIRERMECPEEDKNGANVVDILLDIYQSNSAGVSIDRDSIKAIILVRGRC